MSTAQLADWALTLADQGWPVFPLRPGGKTPALHKREHCQRVRFCRDGHQTWEARATTRSEPIARRWRRSAYNVGLATGPAGLVVLDLDVPDYGEMPPDGWNILGVSSGADVLAYLAERDRATVPATYTVATPSGGTHLYFRSPRGNHFRNTQGENGGLGWLIDTRAHGGYVVAPGSLVAPGGYELVDDREPVELPGWLVRALAPKPAQRHSGRGNAADAVAENATNHRSAYVAAALRNEANRVAQARSGQQNRTLFTAALALGRLVAGGSLDQATARATLHEAMRHVPNTKPDQPWTPEVIDQTITSGFHTGTSRPRHVNGGRAA